MKSCFFSMKYIVFVIFVFSPIQKFIQFLLISSFACSNFFPSSHGPLPILGRWIAVFNTDLALKPIKLLFNAIQNVWYNDKMGS